MFPVSSFVSLFVRVYDGIVIALQSAILPVVWKVCRRLAEVASRLAKFEKTIDDFVLRLAKSGANGVALLCRIVAKNVGSFVSRLAKFNADGCALLCRIVSPLYSLFRDSLESMHRFVGQIGSCVANGLHAVCIWLKSCRKALGSVFSAGLECVTSSLRAGGQVFLELLASFEHFVTMWFDTIFRLTVLPLCRCLRDIFRDNVLQLLQRIVQTMWRVIRERWQRACSLCRKFASGVKCVLLLPTWQLLLRHARSIGDFAQIFSIAMKEVYDACASMMSGVYGHLTSILLVAWACLQWTLRIQKRGLRFLFRRFSRAWWRWIPAGMALQAFAGFGLCATRASAASASLGFALSTWAVGIISLVLVKDAFQRTFAWSDLTNRQFCATSTTSTFYVPIGHSSKFAFIDVMLVYVDLGSVSGVRMLLRVGWRAAGHFASSLSAVAQHSASIIKDILLVCWQMLLLPALRLLKRVVMVIWDSPVLCSASTLTLLALLWAHHSGSWRWTKLAWVVVWGKTNLISLAGQGLTMSTACVEFIKLWLRFGFGLARALAMNTLGQLEAAIEAGDVQSPRLAWVVWIVCVLATKSQKEIRIKTLSWPFLLSYAIAFAGGAQHLCWVMLGVLAWVVMGVRVRQYELMQRARIAQLAGQEQHARHQRRCASSKAQDWKIVFQDQDWTGKLYSKTKLSALCAWRNSTCATGRTQLACSHVLTDFTRNAFRLGS
jgi:hypothetical protein